MLFIFCTHFIWSVTLSCSVTPSFSESFLLTEEKRIVLVPRCLRGGSVVYHLSKGCNTKLCDGALNNLTCVVPTLRYNRFLILSVKLNLAEDNRPCLVCVLLNCSNNVLFIVKPPLILKLYQRRFSFANVRFMNL